MTADILSLLDVILRVVTAIRWIGIAVLVAAGGYVAGFAAWAAWRITRGIRRRAARKAARRRLRARRLAALTAEYGEGWGADTAATDAFYAHIDAAEDLETCRAIWASGVANRKNTHRGTQ